MTKHIHTDEYQATKLRPLIQIVARLVQNHPEMADNTDYLWANLITAVPDLKDKSKCGACGRSMKISIYEADLLDALLILAMAKQVGRNLKEQAISFTEANKVHIPTLGETQGILKRQTKCDYLGLIKQPENWRGSGYWLLTTWALKAIRGDEIPKAVKYWEGNLLGRSQATTTLTKMFKNHRDIVERAIAMKKAVKADYRVKFDEYDPSEWTESALDFELSTD
jgi:hypothetical protein